MYIIPDNILGNTIYFSSDIRVMVKSKISMDYYEDEGPGLYPIYRIVRICRINEVEEQLYDVLDQLWIRNEESSNFLYALDEDDVKSSKEHSALDMIKTNGLFESQYKDHVKNNKILMKIHQQIDLYLDQLEKNEDEVQAEIFKAGDSYEPYH